MARQKFPRCILCRQNDSEPSKEDVIPKWIARYIGSMNKETKYTARTGSFHDPAWPAREFMTKGQFGWVTTGPCRRCNNTWMSALENRAQPILQPLMRAEAGVVTRDQLRTLAQWTLKTALLWEYMHYRSDRYFTRGHRLNLFESLAIPPNTFMFVARYYGDSATKSIGGPLTFVFDGASHTAGPYAYSFTTAIGQVALQIFSFKNPEDERLTFRSPGSWDHVSSPFWPVIRDLAWPPEFALDEDGLHTFAARWRDAQVSKSTSPGRGR